MTLASQSSRASLLGGLYGRVTQARRAWYLRRPDRRRRLDHPVISVGNLASGGSGKTPVVAAIVRLLRARGERPAVLTRGYGRLEQTEGVLVVSDGRSVLEPVKRSGDEPQMLARALNGVPVLVSSDRYLAGMLAERTFGVTVSVLDDGFQHVQLERDVDLVVVSPADLEEGVLPSGHLREPLSTARFADALLVNGTDDATELARACGHDSGFRVTARYGNLPLDPASPVIAVAGIARPSRFFQTLRDLGWNVTREVVFRDHHWYKPKDIAAIAAAAAETGAGAVVTTEKDAVRLPDRAGERPIVALSMTVEIEPADVFASWLFDRLNRARAPETR